MSTFSLYSHLPSLSTSSLDSSVKTPIFLRESLRENSNRLSLFRNGSRNSITVCCSSKDSSDSVPAGDLPSGFCIIEGPETVQDFVQMQLQEIQDNIKSRRNKIFLLMEEVRRLRVQQRIKSFKIVDENGDDEKRDA
ncbi:chaperone protein dnaJ-like protein [Actinidia rufa]|uniref:Chaperone protein dnaJ-like protein n=1 Tax=Actinidia rufa TaxID=165716 RepID=A0A7J0FGU3_9ERIC|nr:chaperone protein dnaJ-like protein [Actinidia rufa]